MRNILILIAVSSVLSSCGITKNTGTMTSGSTGNTNQTSQEEGWISLFDGKSLDNWHTYGKSSAGAAWKVDDGAIHLDASNKSNWQVQDGGDILTDEEYDNFHLKMEWKIAANGNSGIIFYIHEDTTQYKYPWNTGPEMQVLDNNGHPDAKIHKHRAGDLYDLIPSSKETVKPAGEWNQVEIISNKGKLDFYLNGTNVVSTTLWDDQWKSLVAGSKFATMPGFGTYKSGHIALQDHGDNVWFKNIMIKRL
ncbi:3-keto-disaccharide hydrolase [Daejeonella oryzae]|uniref:3-keto-disaccharide hydrolase n=1 Tax=Daejeonella oryzae TaxID=1122943 RepID=UPI0003FD14D8|nr:DUF1080 domain-containing protein [Daejeonella oryzae]